jgi:hypothetical protein
MFLKKFNKLGFKIGLVSGKMSDKGKPENDIFCIYVLKLAFSLLG